MSTDLESREAFAAWWDATYHAKMTWMVAGIQFTAHDEERYAIWLAGVRAGRASPSVATAEPEAKGVTVRVKYDPASGEFLGVDASEPAAASVAGLAGAVGWIRTPLGGAG